MRTRTITGLIALALFLPFIWIGSWPLVLGTCALGVIAIHEIFTMKQKPFFSLAGLITSLITVLIIMPDEYLSFLPNGLTIWNLYFIFAMVMLTMTVLSKNEFTFDDGGALLLASLYIGNGFHYFITTAELGFLMVVFILFIVWATDIGAYLVGSRIGKRKLLPAVSPNKSVEGSIGGIVVAILVAIIYTNFYNMFDFSFGTVIILAILLSLTGQLGDLVESAYKRYYGVKDSGKILPGHGGILDRFDSMLFVMPMFQIFLQIYLLN